MLPSAGVAGHTHRLSPRRSARHCKGRLISPYIHFRCRIGLGLATPAARHRSSVNCRAPIPIMPASTKRSVAKKPATKSPAKSASKPAAKSALGKLPEWNLADLYAGIDDPRVKADLERGDAESIAFEQAYKGKLAALADGPGGGAALAEAVKR